MEKKKLYVNTKASKMVKFLRVLSWILAFAGVIASFILDLEAEDEMSNATLIAGIAFFFIALFIKPVYVRTLAAEIEIAKATEDFDLFSDPEFKNEIKA